MAHLYKTRPNRSSIRAVCDSLGKTSLTSLVGYYWATDGRRVNSSPVKEEFEIFPLFLLGENAFYFKYDILVLFFHNSYGTPKFPDCGNLVGADWMENLFLLAVLIPT